jgi:hypothetical protein
MVLLGHVAYEDQENQVNFPNSGNKNHRAWNCSTCTQLGMFACIVQTPIGRVTRDLTELLKKTELSCIILAKDLPTRS